MVTMPFSICNLVTDRNPFEGFSDCFHPRQREFCARMGDTIIRSHRVGTIAGDPPSGVTQSAEQTLLNFAEIDLRPKVKVFAPGRHHRRRSAWAKGFWGDGPPSRCAPLCSTIERPAAPWHCRKMRRFGGQNFRFDTIAGVPCSLTAMAAASVPSFHPMKMLRIKRTAAAAVAALAGQLGIAFAGTEIAPAPTEKIVAPPEKTMPVGMATLGGEVSSHLGGVYLDSILPLWNPGDAFFFLDTRTTYDSHNQMLSSYGLGARYLVPDHEVIVGINAFYDSILSRHGNDFDELGLGAEILTHWVDARFNYYLPDNGRYEIERSTHSDFHTEISPVYGNAVSRNVILLQQQKTTHGRRTTTRRYESAVEGWNAEIGFLVPGVEKYMELRLFAGAYAYEGFSGFKARAEARPLPGVIANVEYWDDRELMGGHWTGSLAVSVPFSFFNLFKGRNPFEGFTDSFRPRRREFRERMSDMIIRSHRVMSDDSATATSTSGSSSGTSTTTNGTIVLNPEVKKPVAVPPPDIES